MKQTYTDRNGTQYEVTQHHAPRKTNAPYNPVTLRRISPRPVDLKRAQRAAKKGGK